MTTPRPVRAAPRGRPYTRIPSRAERLTRGPKPPDNVIAALERALAVELAFLTERQDRIATCANCQYWGNVDTVAEGLGGCSGCCPEIHGDASEIGGRLRLGTHWAAAVGQAAWRVGA